jgi:hypothetical protein
LKSLDAGALFRRRPRGVISRRPRWSVVKSAIKPTLAKAPSIAPRIPGRSPAVVFGQAAPRRSPPWAGAAGHRPRPAWAGCLIINAAEARAGAGAGRALSSAGRRPRSVRWSVARRSPTPVPEILGQSRPASGRLTSWRGQLARDLLRRHGRRSVRLRPPPPATGIGRHPPSVGPAPQHHPVAAQRFRCLARSQVGGDVPSSTASTAPAPGSLPPAHGLLVSGCSRRPAGGSPARPPVQLWPIPDPHEAAAGKPR